MRHADLDGLRRACPIDRSSGVVIVEKLTLVLNAGTIVGFRRRARSGRGPQRGAARRNGIRQWPSEGYESRHLYAAPHRRDPRA